MRKLLCKTFYENTLLKKHIFKDFDLLLCILSL